MATPTDQFLDWLFDEPNRALQDIQFLRADSREDVEKALDDYDSVDYDDLAYEAQAHSYD